MTRFAHILKELYRNVRRNMMTALSAFLVMILLLFLFDLFWIATGTSNKLYRDFLSELQMEVFITEEATDSSMVTLKESILNIKGVNHAEIVSRELARQQLAMLVGVDLLIGYDTINPLPRSIIISFDDSYLETDKLNEVEERIYSFNSVANIFYSKSWLEKVERTKSIISQIGLFLGGLILLTVLISSASSMSLTTRARASGFEQMRLLGAGKMFLALPFLIEGMLIGFFSAVLGWVVILYGKDNFDITQVEIVFPSYQDITIFCLLAGFLGLISGYIGIRKMLKM
jgi:cell division transport system permease protein